MFGKMMLAATAMAAVACSASTEEPQAGSTAASYTEATSQTCKGSEKGLTSASKDERWYYECDGAHWIATRCDDNLVYDSYYGRCDAKVGPKQAPTCHLGACKTEGYRASSSDTTGYYECTGGCWVWQHCGAGTEAVSYSDAKNVEHVLCCTSGNGPGGCS